MPGATEHVDVKLPNGETITAVVPAGSSDQQIHSLLQQKHPEFFSGSSSGFAPTSMTDEQGNLQMVPHEMLDSRLKQGWKVGPPNQQKLGGGANPYDNQAWRQYAHVNFLENEADTSEKARPGGLANAALSFFDAIPLTPYHTAHPWEEEKDFWRGLSEHPVQTVAQANPIYQGSMGAQQELDAARREWQAGNPAKASIRLAQGAIPLVGRQLGQGEEQVERGDISGAIGTGAGIGLQFLMANPESITPRRMFQQKLAETAHDILNDAATGAQKQLWDAHKGVSDRVGNLINDIATADYKASGGKPTIPMADLWQKIKDTADDYRAGGKDTPKFNAANDAIGKRGQAYLTWKELHDLKQEVQGQWSKAAEGTRDAGATNAVRDAINDKLAARAQEVGKADQFTAYNTLWNTLKTYEREGVMGKLMNAKNGQDFYSILRDPATGADLTRTVKSLSNFGLNADFVGDLLKDHEPLHDYVSRGGGKGFGGSIKAITRRPISGVAGALAGGTVGSAIGHPVIGTILGADAGAALADRMAVARAIQRIGKVPSLAGDMDWASKVEPSAPGGGTPGAPAGGPAPTPSTTTGPTGKPIVTVNEPEVVSALTNLGYRKADAIALARQGIAEHPNDLNAALTRAMQGNASQAKASALQQMKTPQATTTAPTRALPQLPEKSSASVPLPAQSASTLREQMAGRPIEYTGKTPVEEVPPAVRKYLETHPETPGEKAARLERLKTQRQTSPPKVEQSAPQPTTQEAKATAIESTKTKQQQLAIERIIRAAGYEPEPSGFNRELGTITFTDPASPNRVAIMKLDDVQQGGIQAVKLRMAERVAQPEPQPLSMPRKPEGTVNAGVTPASVARAGDQAWLDPKEIKLDPQRFQYKSNVNERGITRQFEGVPWNEQLAGIVHVWRDPETGEVYAVNGHHRVALAQDREAPRVLSNFVDAKNAGEARSLGAIQNIAEGSGTAVDAAKFFRDTTATPADLEKRGVSLAKGTAANGMALAKLDQSIFDKVATGKISEARGVAIGTATADPAEQEAIVKMIDRAEARGKPPSDATVHELARMVSNAGKVETQTEGLFGSVAQVSSLAVEKAEVSSYIQKSISSEQRIFGSVSRESKATQLQQVKGQTIKTQENAKIAQQASQALELYNKLSRYKGPIDTILERAARRLADGDNATKVKSQAYEQVRQEISKTLAGPTGQVGR